MTFAGAVVRKSSRHSRRCAGFLLVLALLWLGPLGARPAAAQSPDAACPEITDAITRLYSAYFLRNPDDGGFWYWEELWGSGAWDLGRISGFFSQSPEFYARYGGLTDSAFIELVYVNVLGRLPDQGGYAFWLEQMRLGLDRGNLMLFFSESPEYTYLTGTQPSVAGDFAWLPAGATFYCGFGSGDVAVSKRPGPSYASLFVANDSASWTSTSIETYDGLWRFRQALLSEVYGPWEYDYWPYVVVDDIPYWWDGATRHLVVYADPDTRWWVIFY